MTLSEVNAWVEDFKKNVVEPAIKALAIADCAAESHEGRTRQHNAIVNRARAGLTTVPLKPWRESL